MRAAFELDSVMPMLCAEGMVSLFPITQFSGDCPSAWLPITSAKPTYGSNRTPRVRERTPCLGRHAMPSDRKMEQSVPDHEHKKTQARRQGTEKRLGA